MNANSATSLVAKNHRPRRLDPFTRAQRERLLQLRDAMVDSMAGVAQDTLRSRAEGSEASAFGMHQADAGSDAYDRDFALSLLSQEQDALYEIDQALKRIELGTYGICEMSGKTIPHMRLEAIPFARFTVQCPRTPNRLEKKKYNPFLKRQTLILNAGDSWAVPKETKHTYKILETFTAVEATSPPAQVHDREE